MPSSDAPAHEFAVVDDSTPDLLKQCRDIRITVFVDEQRFSLEDEIDQYDEPGKSTHILLRLVPSLEPIGAIRVVHLTPSEKKLGRLCVLGPFRGFKFGKDLMLSAHEHILTGLTKDGISSASIKLHSQIYVKGFYEKCGYKEEGPEFEEDGAPHQKMVRVLSL